MLMNCQRHEKSAETKTKFMDALVSIWNKEKCSIDHITVKEICAAAKTSRNTFYYYYEDVYSLLEEIENELLAVHLHLFENFPNAPLSNYRQGDPFPCIYEMNVHVRDKEPYYRALFGSYGNQSFILKTKKIVKKLVLKKLIYDGIQLENADFNLELIASAVIGARQHWLFSNPDLTPFEVSTMIGRFIYGQFYGLNRQP